MFDLIRRTRVGLIATLSGTILVVAHAHAVTTSYHIGNSLTFDSQPEGIASLAATRGLDHDVGFHIQSGSSLQRILANPSEVSIAPNAFGTFQQALPNNAWDIVTLQPHPIISPQTTLSADTQAILSFINLTRSNPANQNTNFYIYQTWPTLTTTPYHVLWDAPSPDEPGTVMARNREYYHHLIEHVRSQTDANVYMVPTGEVFYELDLAARAGELPGYTTASQFYRDTLHMEFDTGRFVAGVTTFATILGQYPTELEKPTDAYGSPNVPTAVQMPIILDIIREVLDSHPYTDIDMPKPLLADFNDDNVVNEIDLQMLTSSMGVNDAFDSDLNGTTSGRDFLNWQRSFKSDLSGDELAQFLISDLNDDGAYNAADLQHWQASYGANASADVDGDGDTDGRDFLKWQQAQPNNLADWNRDYLVNGTDLAAWQDSYGYYAAADANGDGVATSADYDIWQQENGRTWTFPYALSAPPLASQASGVGGLSVPEPSSYAIATVGILLPLTIVRRNLVRVILLSAQMPRTIR